MVNEIELFNLILIIEYRYKNRMIFVNIFNNMMLCNKYYYIL